MAVENSLRKQDSPSIVRSRGMWGRVWVRSGRRAGRPGFLGFGAPGGPPKPLNRGGGGGGGRSENSPPVSRRTPRRNKNAPSGYEFVLKPY